MARVLPGFYPTIADFGLGQLGPDNAGVHLKLGVSSLGTPNQIIEISDTNQVPTLLGTGPLAESVAYHLSIAGGPILAMPVSKTGAAAALVGSIVAARVGSSDGTVTIGTVANALDGYDLIVEITRSGSKAGGLAAFRYTLDGGDTWSDEITLANYTIPKTGIDLVFTDGSATPTFEDGDTFTAKIAAPGMTLANIQAAIDAALADQRQWEFVHVVGAGTPALAAALQVKMDLAETLYRYVHAKMEARDIASADTNEAGWITNLLSEYSAVDTKRVDIIAGHVELVSQVTGRIERRSAGTVVAAWTSRLFVHEQLGKVRRGSVPGIVKLYHDARITPSLDQAGFTTMRTFPGKPGFYITNGHMKTIPTSDYFYAENRRVMDKACRLAYDAFFPYINDDVRVDRVTGFILEEDAAQIEADVGGQMVTGLLNPNPPNASDVTVEVIRNSNMLSDRTLRSKVKVLPLAKAKFIEADLAYRNPVLEAAAAEPAAEEAPA